jgi:poly-gamma-glutamate synthesis protein (capsule biosynthesis protein)
VERIVRHILTLTLWLLLPLAGSAQGIRFPVEFWKAKNPRPDTVCIFLVGDVLSHGRVMESSAQHGYGSFFKYIEKDIQEADLAICNMEFPLGGKPYSGYPVFSGPESFPEYLSEVGFDVFLLGNNHVLDRGSAGLSRTIEQMELRELCYTGVAANPAADTLLNPLFVNVKGLRLAIVNFTYGTNQGASARWPKVHRMNKTSLAPIMARARENADIVLVCPHWGVEYALTHNAEQEEMARWLIQQGAHVIVGSHPHVVQDMEYINDVPVYYSLGNALSNQNDLPARLEGVVTLGFATRLGERPHLASARLQYLWCTKPGMIEDSYAAVPVTLPASYWRDPADYQTMQATYLQFASPNSKSK